MAGYERLPPRSTFLFGTVTTASLLAWVYSTRSDQDVGRLLEHKYTPLKLVHTQPVTPNTTLFRLQLSHPPLHFPPISSIHVKDSSMQIMRPYTPVNDPVKDGYIDLLVKRYKDGTMSNMLHNLALGQSVEVCGPVREYDHQQGSKREIGMIAGGTGITPMYQLIRSVLNQGDDRTKISLIYANRTEQDIILRKELDQMAQLHPQRFKVYYTLEEWDQGWPFGHGYVSKAMIERMMPSAALGKDTAILVSGPDGMIDAVAGPRGPYMSQGKVGGLLARQGYQEHQVWKL